MDHRRAGPKWKTFSGASGISPVKIFPFVHVPNIAGCHNDVDATGDIRVDSAGKDLAEIQKDLTKLAWIKIDIDLKDLAIFAKSSILPLHRC